MSYTDEQIDALLAKKLDVSCGYNVCELNEILANKAGTDAVAQIYQSYTDSYNNLALLIQNEIKRAMGIENSIQTNLSTEINRAQVAESALQTNISLETNRAKNVEASLVNSINALSMGISKSYQTLDLANADKANIVANTIVYVTNDPIDGQNGIYTYNGVDFVRSNLQSITSQVLKSAISALIKKESGDLSNVGDFTSYGFQDLNFQTNFYDTSNTLVENVGGQHSDFFSVAEGDAFLLVQNGYESVLMNTVGMYDTNYTYIGSLAKTQFIKDNLYNISVIPFIVPKIGYLKFSVSTLEKQSLQLLRVPKSVVMKFIKYAFCGNAKMLEKYIATPIQQNDKYYRRYSSNNGASFTYKTFIGDAFNGSSRPIAVKNGQYLQACLPLNDTSCVVFKCDASGNIIEDLTPNLPNHYRSPKYNHLTYIDDVGNQVSADGWPIQYGGDCFAHIWNYKLDFDGFISVLIRRTNKYTFNETFAFVTDNAINYKYQYVDGSRDLVAESPNYNLIGGSSSYVVTKDSDTQKTTDSYVLKKGDILKFTTSMIDQDPLGGMININGLNKKSIRNKKALSTSDFGDSTISMIGMNYAKADNGNYVGYYRNCNEDVYVNLRYYPLGSVQPKLEVVTYEQFISERDALLKSNAHYLNSGDITDAGSYVNNHPQLYGMSPILILKGEVAVVTSNDYNTGFSTTNTVNDVYFSGLNACDHFINKSKVKGEPVAYYNADNDCLIYPLFATNSANQAELDSLISSGNFKIEIYKSWDSYYQQVKNNPITIINSDCYMWPFGVATQDNKNVGSLPPLFVPKGKSIEIDSLIVNNEATIFRQYIPSDGSTVDVSLPIHDHHGYGLKTNRFTADKDCYLFTSSYSWGVFAENDAWAKLYNFALATRQVQAKYISNDLVSITDQDYVYIDEPSSALEINFFGAFATDNSNDRLETSGYVELMKDNRLVFRSKYTMSVSGAGSSGYIKQGWKLAFINSKGNNISIKMGNKMPTTKWRLLAYWTEGSHVRDLAGNEIWRQIQRDNVVPFNEYYDVLNAPATSILQKTDEAQVSTDGTVAIVKAGGVFRAVYTLRTAKDRPNYLMDKDTKTNIHLEMDQNLTYLNKPINYAQWSYANPKMKGYEDWNPPTVASVQTATERLFNWWASCDAGNTDFGATADQYLNLYKWFDYIILSELIGHGDGVYNNIILHSFDAVKWNVQAYDMDWTNLAVGTTLGTLGDALPASVNVTNVAPLSIFHKYFLDNIKARYKHLRSTGTISLSNISKIHDHYSKRIPIDWLQKDWDIWGTYVEPRKRTLAFIKEHYSRRIQYLDRYFGYDEPNTILYKGSFKVGTLKKSKSVTTDITVTGAKTQNAVWASYGNDMKGCVISGSVISADTVRVTFKNNTDSDITIDDSDIYLKVYTSL